MTTFGMLVIPLLGIDSATISLVYQLLHLLFLAEYDVHGGATCSVCNNDIISKTSIPALRIAKLGSLVWHFKTLVLLMPDKITADLVVARQNDHIHSNSFADPSTSSLLFLVEKSVSTRTAILLYRSSISS